MRHGTPLRGHSPRRRINRNVALRRQASATRRYRDTARRAATGDSLLRCLNRNTPMRPNAHTNRRAPFYRDTARRAATGGSLPRCLHNPHTPKRPHPQTPNPTLSPAKAVDTQARTPATRTVYHIPPAQCTVFYL